MCGRWRMPQALCEVFAKKGVKTCSTRRLLHLGQLGRVPPCSASGSTWSKTWRQSPQRYSYVGIRSSSLHPDPRDIAGRYSVSMKLWRWSPGVHRGSDPKMSVYQTTFEINASEPGLASPDRSRAVCRMESSDSLGKWASRGGTADPVASGPARETDAGPLSDHRGGAAGPAPHVARPCCKTIALRGLPQVRDPAHRRWSLLGHACRGHPWGIRATVLGPDGSRGREEPADAECGLASSR